MFTIVHIPPEDEDRFADNRLGEVGQFFLGKELDKPQRGTAGHGGAQRDTAWHGGAQRGTGHGGAQG